MTDDTTDDTTLAQRVDQLEDRLDEALGYQNRVESLIQQFARGQISRRAFLASMATMGAGTWMLSGSARADPEWQNATGQSGTEQTPLLDLYAQNAYHQTMSTEEILTDLEDGTDISGSRSVNTSYQNQTGHDLVLIVRHRTSGSSGYKNHNYRLHVSSQSSNLNDVDNVVDEVRIEGGVLTSTAFFTISARVPDGYYYQLSHGAGNEATINRWMERGMTS